MDVAEVAGRLYRLPPREFTGTRNDAAARARDGGDAGRAAAIKALRRPSAAAWLINLLAHDEPRSLEQLFTVAADLRAAHEARAGAELRRLSHERHRLISSLVGAAARLGLEQGYRAGEQTIRQVSASLDAAVADERAAFAVRSGLLVRSLRPSGFGAVDLDGAVAVSDALPAAPRPRLHAVVTGPAEPDAPSPQQRAVDEAREAAAVAERGLVRAEAALDSADAELGLARMQVEETERALSEANAVLAAARKRRAVALREREGAEVSRNSARRALERAEDAVRTAQ